MKFTSHKSILTKSTLYLFLCLFFLSPISFSLSLISHDAEQMNEHNSLRFSFNVRSAKANPSTGDPFAPTTDPMQGGLNGTTPTTPDPLYGIGDAGITNPSNTSQITNGTTESIVPAPTPGGQVDQAKATTKNPDNSKKQEHSYIVQVIGNLILGIGAACLMVGGQLLDLSIRYLVFEMGNAINAQTFGGAVTDMWTLIRDICNLAFIFGFIYLGIRTIFDPESASVKRTLARIIIGAILINFSLFIVKFVVDFSNFTAYHIYRALTSGSGSITGAVLDVMGVTSFYSSDMTPRSFSNLTTEGALWFYVLGALLLMIAAVVFAIAAVMFVIRFVVLIFLMIGAPVLFAAPVFPQFESTASMLWGKLFSNAFFAPLYLLLLLVCVRLMQGLIASMSGMTGNTLSRTLSSEPTANSYTVVLSFVVMTFFLIQSLLIAQKMGVAGGAGAVNTFHGIRKGAQGYAGRGMMRAGYGKYTLGATMERLQKNTTSPTVARMAGSVAGAKFGSSRSYADTEKENREMTARKNRQEQVSNISTAASNSAEAERKYNEVHDNPHSTQAQKNDARTAHNNAKIQFEQAVAGASTEQTLELLKKHKEGSPERKALLSGLSASQFDSLMKVDADKLDDSAKAKIRQERSQAVEGRLIATENEKRHVAASAPEGPAFVKATNVKEVIGKASGKDLDSLEFNTVVANAGLLSSKQIDDMSLSTTAKTLLSDARNTALIAEFNGGAGAGTVFGRIKSETEIAKLPGGILKDYAAARYLTQGVLAKMLENESVLPAFRPDIKNNVETAWAADPIKSAAFNKFFNDTPAGQQYV